MALTERYVSVAGAGAHDGTSEANAWTLAEALAAAVAGQRVNVKKGNYTLAANWTGPAGTVANPVVWRGYNTTIGDLSDVATIQNPNTLALTTTNFPVIDGAASWSITPGNYTLLEAIKTTHAAFVGSAVNLSGTCVHARLCSFNVTGNGSGGRTALAGNGNSMMFCEILQTNTGANLTGSLFISAAAVVYGCLVKAALTTANSAAIVVGGSNVTISHCIAYSASTNAIYCSTTNPVMFVCDSTLYAPSGVCVALANVASTTAISIVNCMMTDSSYAYRNLNSGTSDRPVLRVGNRTRDNANADAGEANWPVLGAITTDTGGPTSDFVDLAGQTDFRLVSSSPAAGASLVRWGEPGALPRRHQKTVANLRGNLQ